MLWCVNCFANKLINKSPFRFLTALALLLQHPPHPSLRIITPPIAITHIDHLSNQRQFVQQGTNAPHKWLECSLGSKMLLTSQLLHGSTSAWRSWVSPSTFESTTSRAPRIVSCSSLGQQSMTAWFWCWGCPMTGKVHQVHTKSKGKCLQRSCQYCYCCEIDKAKKKAEWRRNSRHPRSPSLLSQICPTQQWDAFPT